MRDINTFLPFWEGFSVVTIKPDGDALQIDLIPHATRFPSCSGCQKPCSTTHEYCERTVRDLPILGRAVRLSVLLRRVVCRDCGKRMEAVSWLDRYARMTRRLAEAVIQACERLPTLHVAQLFGLHWDTVRLLERRALQAALSVLPKARPRRLMDMNTAFDLEVRQHCPNARVVYNLFHVVAKYGREVIDRVRVDEATTPQSC
jgi:transposase